MYDNDFAPAAHFEMVKLMDWMNTPRSLFCSHFLNYSVNL